MAAPVKKKQRELPARLPRSPIMILSLKAGGVGLNFKANHVFTLIVGGISGRKQTTDRVFHQTRNVQVHKFVCTGTLEEKIHEMIEQESVVESWALGNSG